MNTDMTLLSFPVFLGLLQVVQYTDDDYIACS